MSSYNYNGQLFTVNAPFDLAKNELRNAAIQNLGSAPATPAAGQVYFDTSVSTDYALKIYGKHGNTAGWVTLDPMTTIGDIIVGGTNGFPQRLANSGTPGYVLTANAGAAPSWQVVPAGFADPMTTIGDMIYRNGSNATTRLPGPAVNGTYGMSAVVVASTPVAQTWVAGTGTGAPVFATTPTLVTPVLGVATATSINGLAITTTVGTLGVANTAGAALNTTGGFAINLTATAASTVTMPAITTAVMLYYPSASPPSTYAVHYAGAASGTTAFATPPTAAGTYGFVSTPAGSAVAPAWVTGTGTGAPVFATTPTLVTPVLGVATATSINGNTFTVGTGTLTLSTYTLTVSATASVGGTNTGDFTLATNSGLTSTGQTLLALGTPSSVTDASTNSVTTNTHTHAVTGFVKTGGGSSITAGTTTVASGAILAIATGGDLTIADAPVNPTDAANKQYVDNVAIGLTDWKQSVRAATTANVTVASAAPNTVDGVTLAANDRILVKNQTAPAENGIYYVSTLGTGANGVWTRATDADTSAEMTSGVYVYVEEGTATNKGQYVLNTPNPITLGTTGLTFVRFNGGTALTAGNGIDITGDTISVKMPTTTYTQWGIVYASTTAALAQVAAGTTDKALVAVTSGAPVWSKVTLTNPATTATLTLADNSSLITTGAFATTFAASAAVTHTLPGAASKLAYIPTATTPAQYQVAYFNSTTGELANLAVNATATNKFLTQVSSGAPAWNILTQTDLNNAAGGTLTIPRKYATTITGTGTAGAFTINHGLNTRQVQVSVYDSALSTTGNLIGVDVSIVDANNLTVTYGTNTPSAATHSVIVIG